MRKDPSPEESPGDTITVRWAGETVRAGVVKRFKNGKIKVRVRGGRWVGGRAGSSSNDTIVTIEPWQEIKPRVVEHPDLEAGSPCVGSPCVNEEHDHLEPADPDCTIATAETPMVPMVCHDCGVPTHYDTGVDDYRHDDPEAPACFLRNGA
jgi:hypothetical protein